jgi:hypothetical protein
MTSACLGEVPRPRRYQRIAPHSIALPHPSQGQVSSSVINVHLSGV